jgi:hypothetical protein
MTITNRATDSKLVAGSSGATIDIPHGTTQVIFHFGAEPGYVFINENNPDFLGSFTQIPAERLVINQNYLDAQLVTFVPGSVVSTVPFSVGVYLSAVSDQLQCTAGSGNPFTVEFVGRKNPRPVDIVQEPTP